MYRLQSNSTSFYERILEQVPIESNSPEEQLTLEKTKKTWGAVLLLRNALSLSYLLQSQAMNVFRLLSKERSTSSTSSLDLILEECLNQPLKSEVMEYKFSLPQELVGKDTLMESIAPEFQNLSVVQEIVDRNYEALPTVTGSGDHGFSFAICPEVLKSLMSYVQENPNAKIVELGAGEEGATALLLGLSSNESPEIFINDLESMTVCEKTIQDLPSECQNRFNIDKGNCLDFLERHPKLKNKVNIVVVRNVIHFMTPEEKNNLFKMIKDMLAPGGIAVFSTNGSVPKDIRILKETEIKEDPKNLSPHCVTLVKVIAKGIITQNGKERCINDCMLARFFMPSKEFTKEELLLSEKDPIWRPGNKKDRLSIQSAVEYASNPYLKPIMKEHVLEEFNNIIQKVTLKAFSDAKNYNINLEEIFIQSHKAQMYTPNLLKSLLTTHGFKCLNQFAVDIETGHIIQLESSALNKSKQSYVVVQKG